MSTIPNRQKGILMAIFGEIILKTQLPNLQTNVTYFHKIPEPGRKHFLSF